MSAELVLRGSACRSERSTAMHDGWKSTTGRRQDKTPRCALQLVYCFYVEFRHVARGARNRHSLRANINTLTGLQFLHLAHEAA